MIDEMHRLDTLAVVLQQPEQLTLDRLRLCEPGEEDVVVDVDFTGISTGTERSALDRPHAGVPGHGLSPGARL